MLAQEKGTAGLDRLSALPDGAFDPARDLRVITLRGLKRLEPRTPILTLVRMGCFPCSAPHPSTAVCVSLLRKVASEHGAAGVSAQRSSTTCVDAASAVTLLDRSEKELKALVDAHTNALVPARRLLEAVGVERRRQAPES